MLVFLLKVFVSVAISLIFGVLTDVSIDFVFLIFSTRSLTFAIVGLSVNKTFFGKTLLLILALGGGKSNCSPSSILFKVVFNLSLCSALAGATSSKGESFCGNLYSVKVLSLN